jgi:hypothetical protein
MAKVSFKVQNMFFDRLRVIRAMDAKQRKVLARFGAYVRQTAKKSIKDAPREGKLDANGNPVPRVSKPGSPPLSHVGTLRRHIYFSYDPNRRSVVIGPIIFGNGNSGIALPALEYGGKSKRKNDGKSINVQARPFMGPAFRQEIQELPRIQEWAATSR